MAVAALLRSLASKMLHGGARSASWKQNPLLHQRGLYSLPNSGATGSTPPASKIWLQGKVEARNSLKKLNDDLAIHEATNVPRAQVMQNSGHGKQPGIETRLTKLEIALDAARSKRKS